jgi:hypothetical protein
MANDRKECCGLADSGCWQWHSKTGQTSLFAAALDAMLNRSMTKTGKAQRPQRTARRIAGEI